MCILLGAGNWDFGSPHDEFQECSLGQIMVFFCDFMCNKGTSRSIVMAVLAILQGVQPLWCSQTYFAYFWLFWQEIHTCCQYSPEDIPSKLWNTVHHINMCPLPGCNKTYIPVRPQHPDWDGHHLHAGWMHHELALCMWDKSMSCYQSVWYSITLQE